MVCHWLVYNAQVLTDEHGVLEGTTYHKWYSICYQIVG